MLSSMTFAISLVMEDMHQRFLFCILENLGKMRKNQRVFNRALKNNKAGQLKNDAKLQKDVKGRLLQYIALPYHLYICNQSILKSGHGEGKKMSQADQIEKKIPLLKGMCIEMERYLDHL